MMFEPPAGDAVANFASAAPEVVRTDVGDANLHAKRRKAHRRREADA
jgi:hypothetical protein